MINFNLTLVVQMVHFWIMYKFLTAYLFKPAFRLYLEEAEQDAHLERSIKEERTAIQSLQDTIARGWNACHARFIHRRPEIKETPVQITFPYSSVQRVYQTADLKQVTNEIVQSLEKKLKRD